jgi:cobalt-zinc-cadmium efflux system membrane fusion protein
VFEQARSAYNSHKILLKGLSEKLELIGIHPLNLNPENISRMIRVLSPISGYVSKVNVNIGRYISPSEIMFELVNPEDIHLKLTVFEKDLQYLNIGDKVKAYTNSDPAKLYNCDIILIGKNVSPDGHIEVHCHFESYDKSLIPGVYMNANVVSGKGRVHFLPSSAVVRHDGKDYVFVENTKGVYKMLAVQTGIQQDDQIEILNYEELKSRLCVINGSYELLMMLKNTGD